MSACGTRIRHVSTQMRPFNPPGIFVEFLPVLWSPLSRGAVHGDMTVRLHFVTATLAQTDTPYRDEALRRFRLIRAVKLALNGFSGGADEQGRSFSQFQYSGSDTDHNHEQICEGFRGVANPLHRLFGLRR